VAMTVLRQTWRRPWRSPLWSPTEPQEEAPKIASLVVSEAHAQQQRPLPDDALPFADPARPAVGDSRDSLAVSTVSQQRH
jgi:hypothetical protein